MILQSFYVWQENSSEKILLGGRSGDSVQKINSTKIESRENSVQGLMCKTIL